MDEEILELSYKKPHRIIRLNNRVERLFSAYMDHLTAYVHDQLIMDPYTGLKHKASEAFMQSVEGHMDFKNVLVPQTVDEWRRSIVGVYEACLNNNFKFEWNSNLKLAAALLKKIDNDKRITIL